MPCSNMSEVTDARLMAMIQQGDMPAFGQLYEKYGGFVDHAILSIAPSLGRAEVEDLCQDIFLAIRKGAGKYKEEGKLKPWIYSYATRMARQYRRRWAIRNRILGAMKGQRIAVAHTAEMAPDVGAMFHLDMGKLLGRLSEVQRQVLVLYEQDGLRGNEIGELLGMNVNTVWTHLRRARTVLTAQLESAEESKGV
ncbi:MAG: RNA polymerase sigma factor [Deltaproteobacteria bacterium]|nr:RNA polymerase sigma factor [Deltaproteobacteria bacterium]